MESKKTEFLLCLFLGFTGAHRFYRKQYGLGFLYLLTLGLLGLGWIHDLITLWPRKKEAPIQEAAAKKPEPVPSCCPPVSSLKIGKTYRVVGVNQNLAHILTLGKENPDYDLGVSDIIDNYLTGKKIWKYSFSPRKTQLVPDTYEKKGTPSVRVLMDGDTVGYIKTSACPHLLEAMEHKGVEVVYSSIGGGPYKMVYEDARTGKYELIEEEKNYSVTLSIYEK